LATVLRGSGEEKTTKLASELTTSPKLQERYKKKSQFHETPAVVQLKKTYTTSRVQEGLELSRHGTETSTKAKDETISFNEIVKGGDFNIRLGRGVHLGQDFIRKGFRNYDSKGTKFKSSCEKKKRQSILFETYLEESWRRHQLP
jgi:hypothetical protein